MMKIKILSIVALAALFLTSCSNNDGDAIIPDVQTESEGFYIKFSQGVQSKADADEVADGTAVTFTDGKLLFLEPNASGESVIHMVIDITSTSTGGQSLTVTQLQAGTVITNVSEKANKVVVVGNAPSSFSPSTGDKYADVIAELVSLDDQKDADYGVKNASLFGDGDITDVVPSSGTGGDLANADREAIFNVYPLIARLEVLQMTSKDYVDGATTYTIDDYNLEGIYINNFYYKVDLSGALKDKTDFYDFGTDHTQYTKATGYSNVAWDKLVFDAFTPALQQTSDVIKASKFAWAYNVFATPVATPQIVFHLTGVKYSDGTVTNEPYDNQVTGTPGEAYLTVNKYFNSSNEISLQGGNIYRISDLAFDYGDLKETPGGGDGGEFQVFVQIILLPWTVVDVDDVEFK